MIRIVYDVRLSQLRVFGEEDTGADRRSNSYPNGALPFQYIIMFSVRPVIGRDIMSQDIYFVGFSTCKKKLNRVRVLSLSACL